MVWTDDLMISAKNLNFDLSIKSSVHSSTGVILLSFVSNLTFDNHVRHLPNSPGGKDWWLANGPKPTDSNIFKNGPWTPIASFKTKAEVDAAAHKGKRIVSINSCSLSAKIDGDPTHPYIYAIPDNNKNWVLWYRQQTVKFCKIDIGGKRA